MNKIENVFVFRRDRVSASYSEGLLILEKGCLVIVEICVDAAHEFVDFCDLVGVFSVLFFSELDGDLQSLNCFGKVIDKFMQNSNVEHAIACQLSSDFSCLFETGNSLIEPPLLREVGAEQEVAITSFEGVLPEAGYDILGIEHIILGSVHPYEIAQIGDTREQVEFCLELFLVLLLDAIPGVEKRPVLVDVVEELMLGVEVTVHLMPGTGLVVQDFQRLHQQTHTRPVLQQQFHIRHIQRRQLPAQPGHQPCIQQTVVEYPVAVVLVVVLARL